MCNFKLFVCVGLFHGAFRKRPTPAKKKKKNNTTNKKHGFFVFFGHTRTEKNTAKNSVLSAEGAILEAAFVAGCVVRRVGAVLSFALAYRFANCPVSAFFHSFIL